MRLIKVSVLGLLLTSAMGAAIWAGGPTTAQAHDLCVTHPRDPSIGCQYNSHFSVKPCDRHSDGHKVYVRFHNVDTSDPTDYKTDYDPDGAGGRCGVERQFFMIRNWTVCVQYEGCGPVVHHVGPR